MSWLLQWVKQIFILNVLSEIITHIMPSEKYAKYGSYICGLLMVMVCILPVAEVLNGNVSFDDIYSRISEYSQLQRLRNELEYNENDSSGEIIAQFEAELEKEIDEKILDNGYYPVKTEVVIEADQNSDNFGTVKEVNVVISASKDGKNLLTVEDCSSLQNEICEMLNVTLSCVTVKSR
jgi:stage III sporulation protein AF